MTEYPIIVERWTGDQALTIACQRCHATRVIDADEIYNEDIYTCPRDEAEPGTCDGWACMKYTVGDRCEGCNNLGFFHDALNGCCSRACMLQAEYAETLRGAA